MRGKPPSPRPPPPAHGKGMFRAQELHVLALEVRFVSRPEKQLQWPLAGRTDGLVCVSGWRRGCWVENGWRGQTCLHPMFIVTNHKLQFHKLRDYISLEPPKFPNCGDHAIAWPKDTTIPLVRHNFFDVLCDERHTYKIHCQRDAIVS